MYERNYKGYTRHCFTDADYNMGLYKITKGGLMSILNDYRKYSSNEKKKEEWKQEVKEEYRRQEMYDRQQEEKMFYESEVSE